MICLDTNAVIAAINQREPWVRRRLEQAFDDRVTVGIPTVVLYEMWYGIRKSTRPRPIRRCWPVFWRLMWPFESEDAEEAGDIRAALECAGTPIGPYDILIAAQARRRKAVLITANDRELARVPGLKTENWASPVWPGFNEA
jgi:tRNA(fMet)-specific endonuclease VapC